MSKQFFDQGTYLLGLLLYCTYKNIQGKECTTIQITITIAQWGKLPYQSRLHILAKKQKMYVIQSITVYHCQV